MNLAFGYIYKITNKINGKIYIGQTRGTLRNRFYRHCIRTGCTFLHNAIVKYGKDNFSIEEIEKVPVDKLNEREIYWISFYNSTDRSIGYNILKGGNLGNLGKYKLSKESISKIIELEKGGVSHIKIGEMFNIDRKTVTFILKREIPYNNKKVPLYKRNDLEEIKQYILKNNPIMDDVCKKFRIGRNTLKVFTDSFGYKFPTHNERVKARI